ncbi:MAG: hypothetical protein WBD20_18665 [Pirellulaceae bacterium]
MMTPIWSLQNASGGSLEMGWLTEKVIGVRIDHDDLKGADKTLHDLLADVSGCQVRDMVGEVALTIPPSSPIWNKQWPLAGGLTSWFALDALYDAATSKELLRRFGIACGIFDMSLRVQWPNKQGVQLNHLRGDIHSREFDMAFGVTASSRLSVLNKDVSDHQQAVEMYKDVLSAWNASHHVVDEANLWMDPNRFECRGAELFCSNNKLSPRRISLLKIQDFETAREWFEGTVSTLERRLGVPRYLELSVRCFPDEIQQCGEFCNEIAPLWRMRLDVEFKDEYQPFVAPDDLSVTCVHPVWKAITAAPFDPFLDLQSSVEHRAEGSSLLLHTNRDEPWLQGILREAGLSENSTLLEPEEVYCGMTLSNSLKK